MRISRGLIVEDVADGVRLRASDWPWAGALAVPAALAGLPLLVWSLATGNWIEAGGAAVFCAVAAVSAVLCLAARRDLTLRAAGARIEVRGSQGAGPFRREVAFDLDGPVAAEVFAFALAAGAPDLPDRGGDLVLVAGSQTLHLARRTGSRWRGDLEAARARVKERIPRTGR